MQFLEYLKAIFLGIVEGITEWLPVSSTGHMILVDEFIRLNVSPAFLDLFLVVIQLGAILAVAVLFFHKLNPFSRRKTSEEKRSTLSLWGKVIVGVIPAGVLGVLLDDILEEYLMNYVTVCITLVVYGVLFIVIEKVRAKKTMQGIPYRVENVEDLTYKDALIIGAYQTLSLIPGTSRSGSTILGGMLSGVSRTASAEFSFFMALPIMAGASLLKIAKFILEGNTATVDEVFLLLVGLVVAFVVSLVCIRFLMQFVKRHSFAPFGIYRIALGVIVLLYFLLTK
ncbi:MAG: undecaprenyl-diphosphate phosphatase [Clostridia bacterium]|nr:undecaprenyl-diphosphate phosphatase [Clostridia bacterium]